MTKDEILSEIRRTAKANGNSPLGFRQFRSATGIQDNEWLGKYWARWSDAVREAGYTPNSTQARFEEVALLESYIGLLREIGRVPTIPEMRLKKRSDPTFPAACIFQRRLGHKPELVKRVAAFCKGHEEYFDVLAYCESFMQLPSTAAVDTASESRCGYVYLIRHGNRREYKIG